MKNSKIKSKKEATVSGASIAKENQRLTPFKVILIIVGFIFLGIGAIGLLLPVVPTVPFLLVAYFCFMRGFKKLSDWFNSTKAYKNNLRPFLKRRSIFIFSELVALVLISFSMTMTMLISDKIYITISLSILIFLMYLFFIVYVKPISKENLKILLANLDAEEAAEIEKLKLLEAVANEHLTENEIATQICQEPETALIETDLTKENQKHNQKEIIE